MQVPLVRGLVKGYGCDEELMHAVDGACLEVTAGQAVAVMGHSGCGKSALLHLGRRGTLLTADQARRRPRAVLASVTGPILVAAS